MGKKGGGAPSTAGIEEATREATALQKLMYEQGREDLQPWYQAGAGGVSKLSDLLGISGGSVQGRQGIYDELLPQYTSQIQTGGGGPEMWSGMGGQAFGSQRDAALSFGGEEETAGGYRKAQLLSGGDPTFKDQIDYSGLNAAIDTQLAGQGTPEGYGSLLQTFGMDQFQEDPGAQYRRDESQKALERSMAAQGVTMGGAGMGQINPQVAKALQEQSQGLASQEYGAAFDRYNIGQQNIYNRLMGISGMGQGSASQMVGAGQQYGTNVGNLQTGLASAQLQAQQAQQAQSGGMFSNLLGIAGGIGGAFLGGPQGAMAGYSIGKGLGG